MISAVALPTVYKFVSGRENRGKQTGKANKEWEKYVARGIDTEWSD